jgi:hypothetical protein
MIERLVALLQFLVVAPFSGTVWIRGSAGVRADLQRQILPQRRQKKKVVEY